MKNQDKGFTLVELMVTVVVAGILITVGVPSLITLYEGQRSSSTMSTIESSILFSRSQAVSYGSRVTVCPYNGTTCGSDWTSGYSIFIDNGTIGSIDGNDQVLLKIDEFDASDFIKSSLSRFTFNPDGLVNASQSGTIIYCPGKKSSPDSRGININPSGRVSKITTSVNCN